MDENTRKLNAPGRKAPRAIPPPKNVYNIDLEKYFQILTTLEKYLGEFDPKIKRENDSFFTPLPVVSFITRSIHSILKKQLSIPMGLANHTVRILDPAAGTSTFLITAAYLALQEMTRKYGKKIHPFIRHFLLNNLYGIEKDMSLFAISSLNLANLSRDLNVHLQYNERFPLFWSDSLSNGVGDISFNVILGNPPYSNHLSNRSKWISEKIKDYFPQVEVKGCGTIPNEKNLKCLYNDYIKFIRLAQEKIDENGEGVVGFITNNTYLDSPTSRGMRKSLLKSFNEILILNLHGSVMKNEKSPGGSKDENVFDIRQGVAITFFIKNKSQGKKKRCRVYYSGVKGLREDKYRFLDKRDIYSIKWERVKPGPGLYIFIPEPVTAVNENSCMMESRYNRFIKVTDIFPVHSVGIVTGRDRLTIKMNREEMLETVKQFITLDETSARLKYDLPDDSRDWEVKAAREDLRKCGIDAGKVVPILYRPFDIRYTYYTGKSRGFLCMPRPGIMGHMLRENLGLITVRQVSEKEFSHCLAADTIVESRVTSSNQGIGYVFPLYLYDKSQVIENIDANFRQRLTDALKGEIIPTGKQVFYYIYAVLFSNLYRKEYAVHLKKDFPRIPLPMDTGFFIEMSRIGEKLVDLHLLKSPESDEELPGYMDNTGDFTNLPRYLLEYKLCGYPVLQKLLKGFKGRKITADEVEHISRVIKALELTIKYQAEIDRLFEKVE